MKKRKKHPFKERYPVKESDLGQGAVEFRAKHLSRVKDWARGYQYKVFWSRDALEKLHDFVGPNPILEKIMKGGDASCSEPPMIRVSQPAAKFEPEAAGRYIRCGSRIGKSEHVSKSKSTPTAEYIQMENGSVMTFPTNKTAPQLEGSETDTILFDAAGEIKTKEELDAHLQKAWDKASQQYDMQVSAKPPNSRILLARHPDFAGDQHVFVGNSENFVVGMKLPVARHNTEPAFWQLIGPVPRAKGKW